MDSARSALEIAKAALDVMSPMLGRLVAVTTDSVNKTKLLADSGGIEDLKREAERQELTMQMAERQAKVAQELALARRIETALEVEMEEFYDVSASGNVGVNTDGGTLSAGLAGKGQKVMKRVFRFKGVAGAPTASEP